MPPVSPPSGQRKRTMLDAAVGSGKASGRGGRIAVPITRHINTGGIMPRNGGRILLAAMVGLLLAAAPTAAQKQVLHMAYWGGPSHQMVQTQQAWIKTIEEASGGNLTVEVDKAALAKPEGQYDLIRNGVRDLGWAVPGYTVGRFEMLQAAEQPLLCPKPAVCSPVVWSWYAKHGLAGKEFTDTVLLVTFMGGPYGIHTVKPAKTLDEIKALKI